MSGLLLTSVLLTGCGGSGSTSTVATTTPAYIVTAAEKTAITDAVNATPIAGANGGSTIQSNVSTANLDVETSKSGLTFKAAAGGSDVGFIHSDAVTTTTEDTTYDFIRTKRKYRKEVSGNGFKAAEKIFIYGDADEDYFSLGRWSHYTNGVVEVGRWASGGDPFIQANLAGLSSTASYAGRSSGAVFNSNNTEGYINGDLMLRADFENYTIEGDISSITIDGVARSNSITLSSADINTSAIGGFWEGDTSYTAQDGSALTGKWGGNFYGNGDSNTDHPEWVVGRYSLNSGDGTVVSGGFHGKKE